MHAQEFEFLELELCFAEAAVQTPKRLQAPQSFGEGQ